MARTLAKVVALDPDRVSIYNYAHLPDRFPPQRRIDARDLPSPDRKLDMLKLCGDTLGAAGYRYIGMDHFAKPTDELALAQASGSLYRNFQGYSTHADCDLVGMGLSAIGTVGGNFYQNAKDLEVYGALLDAGELAVEKGLVPDAEDRLRRAVIMRLICSGELEYQEFETGYGIDFASHFAPELVRLEEMATDGLIAVGPDALAVTPAGRMLIRNVCMVFDRYGAPRAAEKRFSRAI